MRLTNLAGRGLLRGDAKANRYRDAPSDRRVEAAVDELAEAYATRWVTVVGLIFSKPGYEALTLADAFRFRKSG